MKLLIFMNMPAGNAAANQPRADDGPSYLTHQIILEMTELKTLADIQRMQSMFLLGDQLVYERVGREKTWKSRGPLLINLMHVGKIMPYYEGGSP